MGYNARRIVVAVLPVLIIAVFTGCQSWDESSNAPGNKDVQALYNGVYTDPISEVVPIFAGQTINVGTVKVWNDHDQLHVVYTVTGDWFMTESHVAVATDLSGIPQRNGNPVPGQFPYARTYNPKVQTDAYVIPLGTIPAGTELYIAAHCLVVQEDTGVIIQRQTGWGGEEDFPGKNWAHYFRYGVKKVLRLPTDPVTMVPAFPGSNSYWQHSLSDIPEGFDITNGTYLAWCADEAVYMNPGWTYHPLLRSCFDPDLPLYAQDPDWDMVCYILNHKQGTPDDIQAAIWYFINGGHMPVNPAGIAMVEDALAHGEGYYPGPGGFLPILCLLDDRIQLTFVEVDP